MHNAMPEMSSADSARSRQQKSKTKMRFYTKDTFSPVLDLPRDPATAQICHSACVACTVQPYQNRTLTRGESELLGSWDSDWFIQSSHRFTKEKGKQCPQTKTKVTWCNHPLPETTVPHLLTLRFHWHKNNLIKNLQSETC